MPLFGKLAGDDRGGAFLETLATLLASGVPLLKAMEIVRAVLDNAVSKRS
ncbi:MAG: hypothetical protein U0165_14585 [Polyangiaceae bacterium]